MPPKFKFKDKEEERFQVFLSVIQQNNTVMEALLGTLPTLKGFDGEKGSDGVDGAKGADGKDGETPVAGIDFKLPKDGIDGTDGKDGVDGESIKGKDGKTPTKKELNKLIMALLTPEIGEMKKELRDATIKRSGGGGMGLPVHDQFDGDGSTTSFTLTSNVAAGGLAVFGCRYEGQVQHLGDQYTISGKTLTFTFVPENGTKIEISYIRT